MCIVIANFIISVEINKQFETERKVRAFDWCWQSGNAGISFLYQPLEALAALFRAANKPFEYIGR